jgi:alkanesulfonate monooxygenase SsuD/methylene tetrahydromethanopterin reductase-like flavin-dependent oxidoreductase (luciferase family)
VKVNLALGVQNQKDWPRVQAGDWTTPPQPADAELVTRVFGLADLAEPLGFDGVWAAQHFGTPYGMTPNPLLALSYVAGRTERISLGTMVLVLPWWNPVQCAHEIAYLDILSKGRFDTIGFGRGVAKTEFDALGIDREEARVRFAEGLEIIRRALSGPRYAFEGEIFNVPESSLRPQPISEDLTERFFGASSTNTSLELMARAGLKPLFVGNKPLTEAAKDVQLVNTYRREEGLAPCQPKNILFMYCASTDKEAADADPWIEEANKSVRLHYGFGDPNSFTGVKGYEAYAAGDGSATAIKTDDGRRKIGTGSAYDKSNLLVGTPKVILERIMSGQLACSYSELTVHAMGETMDQAEASLSLFAKEVLPEVHKMDAPLNRSGLPEDDDEDVVVLQP